MGKVFLVVVVAMLGACVAPLDVEEEAAAGEAADALHDGCLTACPGSSPPFARCAPGYSAELCPAVPEGCYSSGIPLQCGVGGPSYVIACCP